MLCENPTSLFLPKKSPYNYQHRTSSLYCKALDRSMKLTLALALLGLSFFSHAIEDMAMLAQEQHDRVLAQLTEKKVPIDIATSVADLHTTDVPTREAAGQKLL